MPDGKIKEALGDKDTTQYLSPYARRLRARREAANNMDAGHGVNPLSREGRMIQADGRIARIQSTEIHARSKKKDGRKSGS